MGPANKVSEVVARNMGSKSPPADAPAPRLQNWREPYRALPNAVLRSALFAVIGKVLSPDECKTLEALSDKLLRKLVRNLDQAYSACRLCDPKACQDCPCRSRGVDEL